MTAATIYMSLLGDEGLRSVAIASHQGTLALLARLSDVPGVSRRFAAPVFHEVVIELPLAADLVLEKMAARGILGGFGLGGIGLERCILVNVTETHSEADLERYVACLRSVLEEL